MEKDAAKAHEEIKNWTSKTREMKLNKFGKEALNSK
jgi:hypothetical protein